jgi:F0F1-type ATP synthase epsilon subunit
MTNNPLLTVVVRNKDKVLYSGDAYAVSSVNEKGPFDVLPEHENFISLIKDKVIVRTTSKEKMEIKIENGIARIYRDKAYIYVNFSS